MAKCWVKYLAIFIIVIILVSFLIALFATKCFGYTYTASPGSDGGSGS